MSSKNRKKHHPALDKIEPMTRSVPEEAKRLGVAAITLYKACQNGEYPAICRSVRIPINQSKVG
jgi:hypothetical protein